METHPYGSAPEEAEVDSSDFYRVLGLPSDLDEVFGTFAATAQYVREAYHHLAIIYLLLNDVPILAANYCAQWNSWRAQKSA